VRGGGGHEHWRECRSKAKEVEGPGRNPLKGSRRGMRTSNLEDRGILALEGLRRRRGWTRLGKLVRLSPSRAPWTHFEFAPRFEPRTSNLEPEHTCERHSMPAWTEGGSAPPSPYARYRYGGGGTSPP
jgi:hypothetical protein